LKRNFQLWERSNKIKSFTDIILYHLERDKGREGYSERGKIEGKGKEIQRERGRKERRS
jgi:hypothetical protein